MFYKRELKKYSITALVLLVFQISIGCSSESSGENDTKKEDTKPEAKDDVITVEENSSKGTSNQVNVSTNDRIGDNGGDADNYDIKEQADNGVVTEITDGVFEYVPNADFYGSDSFTYKITDVDGDEDTGKVEVTVNKFVPDASAFKNIDPNFPSFTSIDDSTPEGKKWVKFEAMSDEFDVWDDSKWFKSDWPYDPPVFMSTGAENSGVTDGNLWIKSTVNESNPQERWFQSARVHTYAETKYPMYTEARIKTSHISAYTTFWLNNGDSDNRDEIDVIENNSNPSCGCQPDFPNQMNAQYFQVEKEKSPKVVRNKGNFLRSDLSPTNPLINTGWNEDYHTYGVWWKDAKNIQFYLDGEPAGSVTVGKHQDGNTYDRKFTRDLEIIFDLWTSKEPWVGGLPTKSEASDNSINTMRVDWVRTWKLEDK